MNRSVLTLVAATVIAMPLGSAFAGDRPDGQQGNKQEHAEKKRNHEQKQEQKAQGDKQCAGAPGLDRLRDRVAKLDLSAEQQEKIKSIFAESKEQLIKAREAGNKDQAREIVQKTLQDVRAVLTPEQLEKFKAQAHEEEAKAREGKQGDKGRKHEDKPDQKKED